MFASCQAPNLSEIENLNFDANNFVENQIEAWANKTHKAKKTVYLNKEVEVMPEQDVTVEYMQNELAVILEADLHKTSLIDQYSIDTNWRINPILLTEEYEVTFTALNDKFKVKELVVTSNDELYSKISSSNLITSYSKEILYEPGKTIYLNGWQKTLFSDTVYYRTDILLE